MKALTVKQPWASLIALGAKHYETRGWQTTYRGPLLITSSKLFELRLQELALSEPFLEALGYPDNHTGELNLPLGCAIATVDLVSVHTSETLCEQLANDPHWHIERQFGDYSPNRYCWKLENARMLTQPVPVRGAVGIFEIPDAIIAAYLP